MSNVDKRNKLDEQIFSYRTTKDGKIFIYWYDKQVKILKGKQASKLLLKISRADKKEKQLLLAKITENFKKGNEK
ncbi:hypothetical protein GM661_07630 [Iocasia frigidifontis]|uniref:Uncharacterized protein n=1 Tax=Iocasia fonsfrigidae TaxID=2682810 RepID=A0A8A7KIA3_9FIRM|nr:hypothetical protein [Iocasia fonsfrigidae]QTL97864.1 hypothetical protein GM661_07630 [Iocasia fonsfrigidae]